MKLHLITIGAPKLAYAKQGWDEYIGRLKRYHQLRITHLPDKRAADSATILQTAGTAYTVALVIDGQQLSSPELAAFLDQQALRARELCFIIGGPEGLPEAVIQQADLRLSFSKLTFPHDLAMVMLAESLYRAGTIVAGHPYHRR